MYMYICVISHKLHVFLMLKDLHVYEISIFLKWIFGCSVFWNWLNWGGFMITSKNDTIHSCTGCEGTIV